MSLFSSIHVAKNSLLASQIGIQVTGNNISNADTPGYVRQTVELSTAPPQEIRQLLLGTGVQVDAVKQQIDLFLEQRLRRATSDLVGGETQADTYLQLESLIRELSETDLSTSLTTFFNSINDVLNQPENLSVRNLAALEGKSLADQIGWLQGRATEVRSDLNGRVIDLVSDVNRLVSEVGELNQKIANAELGGALPSDAVGLRDRRYAALTELASLIDINVAEQPTGHVNVFAGGEYLVYETTVRQVEAVSRLDRGMSVADVRLVDVGMVLPNASGKLAGLTTSRDQIITDFLDGLDEYARTLIFEFNKVYASGQGMIGYEQLTSESGVDNSSLALDQAGLDFSPVNGSFLVLVANPQTGVTTETEIRVDLNGLDQDTSLMDLASALDRVDGLVAQITVDGRLDLQVDSPGLEFAFADDTSGVLAALGVNTFFTGSTAASIDTSALVLADPRRLAVSAGGIGLDSRNAERLAALIDVPLDDALGLSLAERYDRFTGEFIQQSAISRAVTDGFRTFQRTLEGQKLGISGVSLDEEAVNMILYQRTFQASARMIATISEMLDVLVNL